MRFPAIPAVLATLLFGASPGSAFAQHAAGGSAALPQRLSETGLFVHGSTQVRAEVLPFSPQYPLWSDAATKRRWISLPEGTAVDASRPDAWESPVGTRLWKEFSLGRRIETRYIERLVDGTWRFATYIWDEAGTDAFLAPAEGIPALTLAGSSHDGRYSIPSEMDCRACHEGAAAPVLGFSALQLSSDRDPLAPHADAAGEAAVDLRKLVAMGLLKNLPPQLLETPPRIAATSPTERAALGYLHGNCGHCHAIPSESGASVPVGVVLAQSVSDATLSGSIRRALMEASSRFRPAGAQQPARLVVPGHSQSSVLPMRMRSRDPRVQMPPLGTAVPDAQALALVERWIDQLGKDQEEPSS